MATADKLPLVDAVPQQGQDANPNADVESLSSILARVNAAQDTDRMRVGTQLVNVFNYAIQVQAGRVAWTPSDFRAFAIAMQALDSIGLQVPGTDQAQTGNVRSLSDRLAEDIGNETQTQFAPKTQQRGGAVF